MFKNKLIAAIFLIISLFSFDYSAATGTIAADEAAQVPFIEHIKNQYLATTIPVELSQIPIQTTITTAEGNFIQRYLNNKFNIQPQTLTPKEAKEAAFTVVTSAQSYKTPTIIDASVVDKLTIIPLTEKILGHINTTTGKAHAAVAFCHPTTDVTLLEKRSQTIDHLSKNQALTDEIDSIFKTIKNYEAKTLMAWSTKKPASEDIVKKCYFQDPQKNTNPVALDFTNKTYLPLVALGSIGSTIIIDAIDLCNALNEIELTSSSSLSPDDLGMIPYNNMIKTYKYIKQRYANTSPSPYNILYKTILLSALAYKLVPPMVTGFKETNEITKHLQENLIATASHINELRKLSTLLKTDSSLIKQLPSLQPLAELTDSTKHSEKLNNLLAMLDTNTFKGEVSFWSYTGRVLAAYELMKQTKDELTPVFAAAGELDMYIALAKLYNSREGKDARYCLPIFVKDSATPVIDAKGFWNPVLDSDKAVVNDVKFDASQPHSILTGPNTSGKSTVIKAAMANALMAQTVAMVPAQSLTITPFSKLNCYMNISDDIAKGTSLFAAEVKRAKKLLEMVKSLKEKELSFVIIDEIFTGTTPEDGEQISMQFAKHLGSHTNTTSITATHYGKMAELETKTNGVFRNHHVEILRNSDNSLKRTYKLKSGPATLRAAFDILQEEELFA